MFQSVTWRILHYMHLLNGVWSKDRKQFINTTYTQQHRLDLTNALIQSIKRPFNRLENSLVLLQRHQTLFHQLAQGAFTGFVTLKLRVQKRIWVNEWENCIANLLIAKDWNEKKKLFSHLQKSFLNKSFSVLSHARPSKAHHFISFRLSNRHRRQLINVLLVTELPRP